MDKITLNNATAHVDIDAAQHRLEYEEKNLRDFKHLYCCFMHKKVHCRELDDLQLTQHKGRVWVREHFTPWANVELETRQQVRWTKIITAVSEEPLPHVLVTFRGIEADTKQAVIQKLQMIGIEAKDLNSKIAELSAPPSP